MQVNALTSNEHWVVHGRLRFGGIRHAKRYPHRVYAMTYRERIGHETLPSDRLSFAHMDYSHGGTPAGSQSDLHCLFRRHERSSDKRPLFIASSQPECRAASLAWCVLIYEGVDPEKAISRIEVLVPGFEPHPIIALCLDQAIRADGAIFRVARAHGTRFEPWYLQQSKDEFFRRLGADQEKSLPQAS